MPATPATCASANSSPNWAIRTMKQLKSGGVVRQPGGGRRQDGGVPIQPPKPPVRALRSRMAAGMPPLTHGAIHIQRARPAVERPTCTSFTITGS